MGRPMSKTADGIEFGLCSDRLESQKLIHDLKNSLHGIRCGIDLLLTSSVGESERREILTIMRDEQQTARELVDLIADAAKRRPDVVSRS